MSEPLPQFDPTLPPPTVAGPARPSSTAGLTTFPNAFADEPEPGLIPALLSRVKSTFTAATTTSTHHSSHSAGKSVDTGLIQVEQVSTGQTEAQQIAEAVRSRGHSRRPSGPVPILVQPQSASALLPSDGTFSTRPSPTTTIPSSSSLTRNAKPPISNSTSASNVSTQLSTVTAVLSHAHVATKRMVPPGERLWRPTSIAPAQVTVSPVTSVTTTLQASKSGDGQSSTGPPRPLHRAHFGLQAAVASSSRTPYHHHAHSNSLTGLRLRRSSNGTIPDSPSSVSLSAMIAANAELSQNVSHIPGFPLPGDDSRSVRSLGFTKKANGVSRIIRRMRGEGLSKHYWMADERCKECYDCKSVSDGFTTKAWYIRREG